MLKNPKPQPLNKKALNELKAFLFRFKIILNGTVLYVGKNTAAMFAHDDLFLGSDIGLALRRNGVEATTTGIAFYGYYCQTITHVAANPGVGH